MSPDVEAAIASTTTADQKHFASFVARLSWDPEQVCFSAKSFPSMQSTLHMKVHELMLHIVYFAVWYTRHALL